MGRVGAPTARRWHRLRRPNDVAWRRGRPPRVHASAHLDRADRRDRGDSGL